MWIIVALLILIVLAWAYGHFILRGDDLSHLDHALNIPVNHEAEAPSKEHRDVVSLIANLRTDIDGGARRGMLEGLRAAMDNMGDRADLNGITIKPVADDNLKGEWVIAPHADPQRRMLYIHGGAFMVGSPKSHRTITTKLSRTLGICVFAVDYRLMPEHKRLHGLHDCEAAYRWLLAQGPDGPADARQILVAGDSAGGNLALVISAWTKQAGIVRPDGVIAIAPATDSTLSSPTLRQNISTDPMLGPALGRLVKLPRALLAWLAWLGSRVRPTDPRVSPLHGDLADLPPTLIHASESEMLLGDARRYANKAKQAGSPVTFATWRHMVHVWHVFEPSLPEAKHAFEHIAEFVDSLAPQQKEMSA